MSFNISYPSDEESRASWINSTPNNKKEFVDISMKEEASEDEK
jgi:hypothetical protein